MDLRYLGRLIVSYQWVLILCVLRIINSDVSFVSEVAKTYSYSATMLKV